MRPRRAAAALLAAILLVSVVKADSEDVSDEEMESINTIVRDTKIVKALEEEAQRQTRRVDDMQLRLERELQGIREMMEETLDQIKESQRVHIMRAEDVEKWMDNVDSAARELIDAQASPLRTWGPPFVLLLVVIGGFAIYSQRQFRRFLGVDMIFNRKSNTD